ncbi:MAG: hypothetical protein ACRD63_05725 [Pyrinomonadaceae bacterium]
MGRCPIWVYANRAVRHLPDSYGVLGIINDGFIAKEAARVRFTDECPQCFHASSCGSDVIFVLLRFSAGSAAVPWCPGGELRFTRVAGHVSTP